MLISIHYDALSGTDKSRLTTLLKRTTVKAIRAWYAREQNTNSVRFALRISKTHFRFFTVSRHPTQNDVLIVKR